MKKLIIIFVIVFSYQYTNSQVKDTVYICFDRKNHEMKKESFKAFKSKKYPNEDIKTSYAYKIDEKTHENPYLYDTGYTFTHYNRGKFDIERGSEEPLIIIKDIKYLDDIKAFDADFFRNTEYLKVCKTFEAEDSREQDVIIFIIDKDEIKDGKMVLREVDFSRPVKQ